MRIGFISGDSTERIAFMKRHGFGCVELAVGADADFLPGHDGWESKAAAVKGA